MAVTGVRSREGNKGPWPDQAQHSPNRYRNRPFAAAQQRRAATRATRAATRAGHLGLIRSTEMRRRSCTPAMAPQYSSIAPR